MNHPSARRRLMFSAQFARNELNLSMQQWIDDPEVREFCELHALPEELLEHIAWWVWKPIKG